LRLGAHAAVNGKEEDIAEAARRFAPNGVDAVLALAGGTGFQKCLDATRKGSRVAYPNGVEPVPGERKGIAMLAYDAVAGIKEFEKLNRVIIEANPEIDVPIAGTYSLASAAKAHERIEEGHVLGKIVVRIGETEL